MPDPCPALSGAHAQVQSFLLLVDGDLNNHILPDKLFFFRWVFWATNFSHDRLYPDQPCEVRSTEDRLDHKSGCYYLVPRRAGWPNSFPTLDCVSGRCVQPSNPCCSCLPGSDLHHECMQTLCSGILPKGNAANPFCGIPNVLSVDM